MASPTGYLLTSYGDMIANEPRTPAYAAALRKAVTPGCKVIDIGAGPGLFALLACEYGAESAVAIEPDDSVLLLKATARSHGFEDRIEIVHDVSSAYRSDRQADVIISDLRGILPLFESHIPAIIDARERLLRPGGAMIPARDILHIALVEHEATHGQFERPWLDNGFGVDLSAGHRFVVNRFIKVGLGGGDLISSPKELLTLDYATIASPNVSASATMQADRAATAHGFVIWFDAELSTDIGFSNAPGEPEQVYGQAFFPFERPIAVAAGDTIAVEFRADLVAGSYIYSWTSHATLAGREALTYRQSTFRGRLFAPAQFANMSPNSVPPALSEHEVDRFCLSLFDGATSLGVAGRKLAAAYPQRFATDEEGFEHASRLARRYKSEAASDAKEPS